TSVLLTRFSCNGRGEINRMSTKLWWLATTTYGRRGSLGTLPDTLNFQSGLSFWCTTATLRNSSPALYRPSSRHVTSRISPMRGTTTNRVAPSTNHDQTEITVRAGLELKSRDTDVQCREPTGAGRSCAVAPTYARSMTEDTTD